MPYDEFILGRDCRATLVPAGDEVTLPKGTPVTVTQALGGTVTVRTDEGLYRIGPGELDALGADAKTHYAMPDAGTIDGPFSEEAVWDALRMCFDPEIPVNIADLGLIYDLAISPAPDGKHHVAIKMTLTAPGCGMGPVIADDAKRRVESLAAVASATVSIVWEPQWTPHMITPAGRQALGMDA